MAIYNEILVARYARMLQKLFGVKGAVPTKQLSGEIMPVFAIFAGGENRYLEGWDRFGFQISVPAGGAATFAKMRLRNPTGSNVIAVIERAFCGGGSLPDAPIFSIGPSTADLTTLAAPAQINFDSRGRIKPTVLISSEATAGTAIGGASLQGFFAINSTFDFVLDSDASIPLLPGFATQISSNQANQGITPNFIWRERSLEESERT